MESYYWIKKILKIKNYILKKPFCFFGISVFLFVSLSSYSFSKTLLKDRFIYKVAGVVQSYHDLKSYYEATQDLKCMYGDSLFAQSFGEIFTKKMRIHFGQKDLSNYKFTSTEKTYFLEFMKFSKLLVYSKSNRTFVSSNLNKAFLLAAKKLGCSMKLFQSNGDFKPILAEIVRLEVFIRLRFLPEEKRGKATKSDFKKAIISTMNFVTSINKQISGEIFW